MFPESELSQKDVELISPLFIGLVSCESRLRCFLGLCILLRHHHHHHNGLQMSGMRSRAVRSRQK